MYSVEFTKDAVRSLRKLDPYTRKLILAWIHKNLEGCDDPRAHGKGLTANRSGQWRYRVGDYRILADIQDDRVIILVLDVGHRSDIYE